MKQTDVLREQHDAALAMARRLLELVDCYQPGSSAYPILLQVNRLFGFLRAHLAQENAGLYRDMAASKDRRVAKAAKSFAKEMGRLAVEIEDFTRHWCCTAAISRGFEEFRESVNNLVLAISVRIERENRLLYALAELQDEEPIERSAA